MAEKLSLEENNSTYTLNENVSDTTLQTAAKMYIFLNYCPPTLAYFLNKNFELSPNNILLSLVSIMKTSRNCDQRSSSKIFTKAMEMFELRSYKDLNIITKENGYKDKIFDSTINETVKLLGSSIFYHSTYDLKN